MINDTKVLILCNDSFKISDILANIRKYDYEIILETDIDRFYTSFKKNTPSVIVIEDGTTKKFTEEILIDVRKITNIPVVVMSEKTEIDYKLICYSIGVDEFLTLDSDPREISARINAVIRRTKRAQNSNNKEILYDNLYVNISSYEVSVSGETFKLPPKETELLYFLAKNPNIVFTREQLLDHVWGYDYFGDSRTVDVHIKKLRKHLNGKSDSWKIETVWGVGYKFQVS